MIKAHAHEFRADCDRLFYCCNVSLPACADGVEARRCLGRIARRRAALLETVPARSTEDLRDMKKKALARSAEILASHESIIETIIRRKTP